MAHGEGVTEEWNNFETGVSNEPSADASNESNVDRAVFDDARAELLLVTPSPSVHNLQTRHEAISKLLGVLRAGGSGVNEKDLISDLLDSIHKLPSDDRGKAHYLVELQLLLDKKEVKSIS